MLLPNADVLALETECSHSGSAVERRLRQQAVLHRLAHPLTAPRSKPAG